jgi:SAM-dependent methyltransferase
MVRLALQGMLNLRITASLPEVKVAESYAQQDACIAAEIRAIAARAPGRIEILEAGCGNKWPINLSGVNYHLTGCDLDAAALELRRTQAKDLDASIHGDLCRIALPLAAFDVVYSAYVLEHIRDADVALDNLMVALKPGGLLILRVPDPDTARGFVTRRTPFWFHVIYHRWVMKQPNAGKPGYAPYPTYYHSVISKRGMAEYAQRHSLRWRAAYSDNFVRDGKGLAGAFFRACAKGVSWLTLQRYTSNYNDLVYILEKA